MLGESLQRFQTAIYGGVPEEIKLLVAALSPLSPEDQECALEWAVAADHGASGALVRVRSLVEAGTRVFPALSGGLGTCVHLAASRGYLDVVIELLGAGGLPALHAFDDSGWTPLHHAVAAGSAPVASLLLDRGAEVDRRDEENSGDTALRVAVQHGREGIVELLLCRGANPDIAGWMKLTASDVAVDLAKTKPSPERDHILELLQNARS